MTRRRSIRGTAPIRQRSSRFATRSGLLGVRDERGTTMIEMLMVMLTLGILLGISLPIVATLLRTTSRVSTTYGNVDQQLWLSTNLQRLVRSAVATEPSWATTSNPPFLVGKESATSMTFTTNVGATTGPEEVTAACTPTSSDTTRCAAPTATFTITVTPAKTGTCPRTATTHTACKWTTAKSHLLVRITHVKNGTEHRPLFIYTYDAYTRTHKTSTPVTVCGPAATPSPAGITTCTTNDASAFSSCSGETAAHFTSLHPFVNCPVGEIAEVHYDLTINSNTSTLNGGNQAEDDTGVFEMSPTSMLFEPSVG